MGTQGGSARYPDVYGAKACPRVNSDWHGQEMTTTKPVPVARDSVGYGVGARMMQNGFGDGRRIE